jgi:ATP-binding protein involved in chromosome partitioning
MSLKVIQNEIKRSVAVAAGKGGVGKSTLTLLLAAALKRVGERVGVLDADLYGPSLRQMLPEEQMPMQKEGKWLPAMAHGIQMLSYSFFSKDHTVRAPVANQILRQLLQNVFWGGLDWLLIDFPPGTGDIPLTITQLLRLSGAVIITTPQKVATLDVQKTIDMFRKVDVPILGIVENMSYFKEITCTPFGTGGGVALSEENGIPFLGKIPLEPLISEYADRGRLHEVELDILTPILGQLKLSMEKNGDSLLSIALEDQKHLKIVWENGTIYSLEACVLQKSCPCARCTLSQSVQSDVLLLGFERIGRYALRFDFSSGCSAGIYPFTLLRRLVRVI